VLVSLHIARVSGFDFPGHRTLCGVVQELGHGVTQDVARGAAEHAGERGIDEGDLLRLIDDHDTFR
jgi:hypothetical protein